MSTTASRYRRLEISSVLVWATALLAPLAPARGQDPGSSPWRQYADPAEGGFSPGALEQVCARADSLNSGALMAVHRGHVVLACGDVARELEAHSVRKSLVSGLFGSAIQEGAIDLNATLGEIGIDDDADLTPTELSATLRDILSARSGVYVPAAYAPSDQDAELPERGAHPPGTNWFYNNWDFNIAGVAFEMLTGEDLFAAFERRIAAPIGMEDWEPTDGTRVYEPPNSRHPAHTFRISARDLARFGLLYLQEGLWNGERVVPGEWIAESTRPHSALGDGTGYGYMWWIYGAGSLGEDHPSLDQHDLYMASGTGGQALYVIPGASLVVVHRGDTDHGRDVDDRDVWGLVEGILAARAGDSAAQPALEPLEPMPFANQLPPLDLVYAPVPDAVADAILGEYELSPGVIVRIYRWQDGLYVHMPGEGDAALFALPDGALTVRIEPDVRIEFERQGELVTGLVGRLGRREFRGSKVR